MKGTVSIGDLVVSCDVDLVSDGRHTIGELYDHRHLLFIAFANAITAHEGSGIKGFKCRSHNNEDPAYQDYYLAGLLLPQGEIRYHLPAKTWSSLRLPHYDVPPRWDGHTSLDILDRLEKFNGGKVYSIPADPGVA